MGCDSDGDSESIFRDSTLLRFDSFFASLCGIPGDSRPAILGIARFAIRDSVPLSPGLHFTISVFRELFLVFCESKILGFQHKILAKLLRIILGNLTSLHWAKQPKSS